eukprot:363539-Chlamydomonas_euryale.AAC.1
MTEKRGRGNTSPHPTPFSTAQTRTGAGSIHLAISDAPRDPGAGAVIRSSPPAAHAAAADSSPCSPSSQQPSLTPIQCGRRQSHVQIGGDLPAPCIWAWTADGESAVKHCAPSLDSADDSKQQVDKVNEDTYCIHARLTVLPNTAINVSDVRTRAMLCIRWKYAHPKS